MTTISARDLQVGDDITGVGTVIRVTDSDGVVRVWTAASAFIPRKHYSPGAPVLVTRPDLGL